MNSPLAKFTGPDRRRGQRRFQDVLRMLEHHRVNDTDVGDEMRSELVRRGIRIPSEASILDLMSLVIDAEAPYLRALQQERRARDRRAG